MGIAYNIPSSFIKNTAKLHKNPGLGGQEHEPDWVGQTRFLVSV